MRTGIIHLAGMSALCALFMTLILWGDSYRAGRQLAMRLPSPPYGLIVISGDGQVHAELSYGRRFQEWFSIRHALDLGDLRHSRCMDFRSQDDEGNFGPVLAEPPTLDFAAGWSEWYVIVSYWVLAAVWAVPGMVYVRFIVRRRTRSNVVERASSPPTPTNNAIGLDR